MRLFFILIFFKISITISFINEFISSKLKLRNIIENSNGNDTKNNTSKNEDISNKDDPEMLGKIITHLAEKKMNLIYKNYSNISFPCQNFLKYILHDSNEYRNNFDKNIGQKRYSSREYAIKTLLDSSKTSNELTYYDSCISMTRLSYPNLTANYSYFVLFLNNFNRTNKSRIDYEESYYLYGFCVPDDGSCSSEDYTKIYNILNADFEYAFSNRIVNISNDTGNFLVNKREKNYKNLSLSIIIVCIISFWCLLIFLRSPIFFLLKLCFRKKNILKTIKNKDCDESTNGSYRDNKYFIPKWLIKLNSCFSLSDNFEELFNVKTNISSMNNYSGLTEIRGLTSISMFFTILGFTCLGLFNCPVKNTGIYQIRSLLRHFLYYFVFIGLRFSPRILISCNGYSLIYKYLCYIDKYAHNFSVFRFVIYQSYKYFLLIILILNFRFGLDLIYMLFKGDMPIWRFFHKIFMEDGMGNDEYKKYKSKWFTYLIDFLGYKYFLIQNTKLTDKELMDYFWVPFNDIIFFLFGIILITFGYKCKLRIDIFIIVLIPLTIFGKVVFSYLYIAEESNPLFPENKLNPLYSTLYYYMFDYGKFMTNPLFNLPYFLIGLHFGLINYSLQNGVMNKFDSSIYSKINSFSFLTKDEDDKGGDLFQDEKEGKEIDEDNNKDKKKDNIINNSNEISNLDIIKGDKENEKLETKINNKEEKEEKDEAEYESNCMLSKTPVKNYKTETKKFPFLKFSIKYINYRKRSSEVLYLIIAIILIAPLLVHSIFLKINQNNLEDFLTEFKKDNNKYDTKIFLSLLNLESYLSSNVVNAVFRVDIEFFVFFIHLLIFILQVKGRNNILSFFTDIRWGIFSKCYFSFSVLCNMVILFSIYSAESLISVNIYTIYLYFIFNTILIIFYMSFTYICFELPLKKLIKNLFYKSKDNNDADDNIDKSEQDNIDKDNEPMIDNEYDEDKLILKDEDEDDDDL